MASFFGGLGGAFLRGAADQGTSEIDNYEKQQADDDASKRKFAQEVNLEQVRGNIEQQNSLALEKQKASDSAAKAQQQKQTDLAANMAAIGRDIKGVALQPQGGSLDSQVSSAMTTPQASTGNSAALVLAPQGTQAQQQTGTPAIGTNPSGNMSQAQATGSNTMPNGQQDNQDVVPQGPTPIASGQGQPAVTGSQPVPMSGNSSPESSSVQNPNQNNSSASNSLPTNIPAQTPTFADRMIAKAGLNLSDDDKARIQAANSPVNALSPQEAVQYVQSGNDPNTLANLPSAKAYTLNKQYSDFGFDQSSYTPQQQKELLKVDAKAQQASANNMPIAENVNRILDNLEPNLKNFTTGTGLPYINSPGIRAGVGKAFGTTSGDAAANIEKDTNDLATELNKFQYVPGMRASVLGLKTILASKPGIDQPENTNTNIIAGLRAKVNDYVLSEELASQYRDASPLKITDSHTQILDGALKTIYPLQTTDPKTGAVIYNADNAVKIAQAIPDAIKNPDQYLQAAAQVVKQKAAPVNALSLNNGQQPQQTQPSNAAQKVIDKFF